MALFFSNAQHTFDFVTPQNATVKLPGDAATAAVNQNEHQPCNISDAGPASFKPKIRQILRNISSVELELFTEGCKEFIKLLKGTSGGELLFEYAKLSVNFSELLEAWNSRRGKVGVSLIIRLISVILDHPVGKFDRINRGNDSNSGSDSVRVSISRSLDKFARVIVEERMEDLVKELGSKEGKRQKAALLLLGSVVRRGAGLADEVAKKFDFKAVPGFGKLAEYRGGKKVEKKGKRKGSTRGAFVEFAMSFLELGKSGLLRLVLQQREVFSGILRGLGDDDDETVVYILSTLRDRVLRQESGVPPALRSVLFGSVTLEQLVGICARGEDELVAKVAIEVLLMVCTDPSNGLMPDLKRKPVPLKGNHKRLIDMMKKLKASDVEYHRRLLLAIVNGRPALASSYLDQFPYNLEDHSSSTWLSAVTLAANVVSSVRDGIGWDFLSEQADKTLTFENPDVQSLVQCVCLRAFSRPIVNKGLLHSDPLIKHGTLRLLMELLQLFSSLMDSLSFNGLSSLKQKLQDEVMIFLPDPQVLFTLISSIPTIYQNYVSSQKRKANAESIRRDEANVRKKQKVPSSDEDIDIIVPGLDFAAESSPLEEVENPNEVNMAQVDVENDEVSEIWGSDKSFVVFDAEVYFHCKVVEALKLYHRTLRDVLEVSYDVLKLLPNAPLGMPSILMQSLLSMMIEHFGCSIELGFSSKVLPSIYKHLQSFLVLFLHSSVRGIREQAYLLAIAAMMSTGAFDRNASEIGSWFFFLPGNIGPDDCCKYQDSDSFQSLSMPVVSFLCEAVSTVGNNLFKYWGLLKCQHSSLITHKGVPVEFSPLAICVLEKCLRLVCSGSERFKPENSLISSYVCSTLKVILQIQVVAGGLAAVVHHLLSEVFENHLSLFDDVESCACEWRPLVCLKLFSRSILLQETFNQPSGCRVVQEADNSFVNALTVMKSLLAAGGTVQVGMFKAVYFTILSTAPGNVVGNLPAIMAISGELPGFDRCMINYFGDHSVIKLVSEIWPDMFYSGLRMSVLESSLANDKPTSDRIPCRNSEMTDYGASVIGSLLKETPFYILFPGLLFCGQEHCFEIKELLVTKVSALSAEQIISSLRLILFWLHQLHLSYGHLSSELLEWGSELCCTLVEHILLRISNIKKVEYGYSTCSAETSFFLCIEEVAKTVFIHPVVSAMLSNPCSSGFQLTEDFCKDICDGRMHLYGERIPKTQLHIFKLLTTTSAYLSAQCSGEHSSAVYTSCKEQISISFKNMVMHILSMLKDKVLKWDRNMSLLPILSIVCSLACFISPIDLLELAKWIISEVDLSNSKTPGISIVSPSCLALSIACVAFDLLSQQVQSPNMNGVLSDLFWVIKLKDVYASLFQSVYLKAFESATTVHNDIAYTCLLKALSVARCLICKQDLSQVSMEIFRVIACTPPEIISYCVQRTDNTKAKILSLLIEISPLHCSIFGNLLSGMLSNDYAQKVKSVPAARDQCLSDEDYLILLPAAFSFKALSQVKIGEGSFTRTKLVPPFYSKLLMDGIINQEGFLNSSVFKMEYGDSILSSVQDFDEHFNRSLLGKAVDVLQTYSATSEDDINNKLDVVRSVLPSSVELQNFLNFDILNIKSDSYELLLNSVSRVVAKVSICMGLLIPSDNNKYPVRNSDQERVKVFDMLVHFWIQIVEKFPFAANALEQEPRISVLVKSLEVRTLRSIHLLTQGMHDFLIQNSLPLVEKMTEASLRHRFGDPTTLRILRQIVSLLSDGKFPVVQLLQQLLGHTQFASAVATINPLSNFNVSGLAVKPISSLLKPQILHPERSFEKPERYECCLEVIKLLRLLLHVRSHQQDSNPEADLGINLQNLALLLLSSYGATVSEIDMEINGLLSEIESLAMNQRLIANVDYLWGGSIGPIKEKKMGHALLNTDMEDEKQEDRRSHFRDNLSLDSEILIKTILHFPYNTTISERALILDNSNQDHVKTIQRQLEIRHFESYDPVFLLSFSINSLSKGYLDAMEFAGLGLLGVALVSIASASDGLRKLGYVAIEQLKDMLKSSPKRREVKMFERLLLFPQSNEQLQKIPSIFAVFAAEASVVILDPSHEHFKTVSELLLKFSWTNLEHTPLFHDASWSSFVISKTDRLWMLRLLYAGINTEDDAHIFVRNSVPEKLLRFYSCSVSDFESKELILQVVRKCVKVQTMARHLVEKCSLVSWLSSILVFSTSMNDEDTSFSEQLLLEVVQEIVSSQSTMEWLQNYALEQLSGLSCHLLNMLVTRSKVVRTTIPSADLMLKVILSCLEISQNRNAQQPHFTPSMRTLYDLYEAVDAFGCEKMSGCAELGLKAILLSMPSATVDLDSEELSRFLIWAVSTALDFDYRQALQKAERCSSMEMFAEMHMPKDSLTSALLRWIVASVLRRSVACSPPESGTDIVQRNGTGDTLLSFMEHLNSGASKHDTGCEKHLAVIIFYLQQLLGLHSRLLPSSVAALSILLLSDKSDRSDVLPCYSTSVTSLWSKICYPPEANPSWKWSFRQSCEDLTEGYTDKDRMNELHSCQNLLVLILEMLENKSLDSLTIPF